MGRGCVRCGLAGAAALALTFVVLLAGVAVPGATAAEPQDGGAERHGAVHSRLVFDADRSGELNILERTRLRAPVAHPMAQALLKGPRGPGEAGAVREWFESGLDLYNWLVLDPASLESVDVQKGWLRAEGTRKPPDDPREEPLDLGSFVVSWDDGVRIATVEPDRSTDDVGWVVVLELDQVAIESIAPPPSTLSHDGSRTTVEWRFPPGAAVPAHVDLELPWAVRLAARDSTGWSLLPLATLMLVAFLPLVVFFVLLRRRDLRDALPDVPVLGHQLNRLLIAAACLILGIAALLVSSEMPDWFAGYFEWPLPYRVPIATLPKLLIAGFAAAVFAAGRAPTAWRWIAPVWGLVVAVGILSMVTADTVGLSSSLPTRDAVLAGLQIVGLFSIFFGTIDGLARVSLYWLDAKRDRARAFPRWRPRADVPALLLSLGLLGIAVEGFRRQVEDVVDVAYLQKIAFFAIEPMLTFALSAALFVGMALLPAAVRLLSEVDRPAPFLVGQRGRWLLAVSLFLLFVVPPVGTTAGIPVPIPLLVGTAAFAMLAAIRLVRLERVEWEVALLNRGRGLLAGVKTRLLMRNQREIVDRALLIGRLQRERTKLRQRGEEDGGWAEGFVADRGHLGDIDVAEQYLQTGLAPPGSRPSRADRATVTLRFPPTPPLLYPALGCGPGADWKECGQIAFRYGARLAVLPLAIVLLFLLRDDLAQAFHSEFGMGLLLVVAEFLREGAFWLVAAFTFGCLFAWLPGTNGALKGLAFSLPVAIAVGTESLFPIFTMDSEWVLRSFALLLFLSLLGLLLDFRTVREAGLRSRSLAELYQVRSLRFGLVNLVPLAIAAVAIYQGFRAGNPQEAVERALESAPSFPSGGGAGETGAGIGEGP